jgi:two-component system cell cycle response regulator
MRHLLLSGLSRSGYEVDVAASGDHAWSVLQRPEAPEIAILDWMMPGITGLEICQKLRERTERNNGPYVYVIMLTGLDAASDLAAGLNAGADDYMTKPFKQAELSARLRNAQRILALQRDLSVAKTELRAALQCDPLTSLANRRTIRTCLDAALAQAQRQQQSLGVMLLDIDELKMLNDTWGEAEGDVILQRVATRLTESIGPDDSVGRFAAGRFMIVVPACNMYETVMLAERIRKSLCDTPIDAGCGPIPISASFGVSAGLPEPDQAAKPLIEAAQRALQRAKAAGGNRVYLAASDSQAVVIGEKQTPVAETGQPRMAT